ncbi:hypothetical protein BH09ACT4_BH09ACT4_03940 [soil metagenome]
MVLKLSEVDFIEVKRLLDSERALGYEVDTAAEDEGANPPPPLSANDAAEVQRIEKRTA